MARLLAELEDLGVPRIVFGVGAGHLLEEIAATGADAIGVDWRTPLGEARRRLGPEVALQGNLDPSVMLAPWPEVRAQATAVLQEAPERGYVFNLGHGMPEGAPADLPARVVELVHEHGLRSAA